MVVLRSPLALLLTLGAPLAAHELDERLSVTGPAAVVGQCQLLSSGDGFDDLCRAAVAIQPALSFHPNERHEVFVKLGLATGNGLTGVGTFNLDPWAADLRDTIENINGGGRDFLLTAWYRH